MNETGFYTEEELKLLGFKKIGKDIQISRNAKFYGVSRISIGDYSRIDDFCVISAGKGGIEIGRHVHIAVFVSLQGDGKIILDDFVGLSSKTAVYSSNGDYMGFHFGNPNFPDKFKYSITGDVTFKKHALVGSGSVILPGVTMEEGAVAGALSFVRKDCESFWIYAGNPLKKIKQRDKKILEIEKELNKYEGYK